MYNILIDFRETVSYTHWPEIRYTYLSSVFLSIGTTVAILALFGKVEVLILLLMAIDSGSAKMSDASLTGLLGILSRCFFGIQRFQDDVDFLRCYFRAPTERGYRNRIGL